MSAVAERWSVRRAIPGVLVGVLFVAACAAIAGGVFSAAIAATGRGTAPAASVRVAAPLGTYGDLTLPCVEGWSLGGRTCEPAASPGQWPSGEALPVRHDGGLVTEGGAVDIDRVTAVLGTATTWSGLITGGAAGLLLIPVVRSLASGRPFVARNDRRLAFAAVLVGVGWAVATMGDFVAGSRIIHLLETTPVTNGVDTFTVPAGWLAPDLEVAVWPLTIVVMLAVLAAVTRAGTRLASGVAALA